MNHEERDNLESLKQRYVDGQLTERQRTELKRLIQRAPSLVPELRALRRQRELLKGLPIEKPPESLFLDIQSALERNMILASQESVRSRKSTAFSLVFRRVSAVAAMLIIPLGLLAIVVYQIVRPAQQSPPTFPGHGQVAVTGHEGSTDGMPLEAIDPASTILSMGRLIFHTDQPIAVNGYIKKTVFSRQMLEQTIPIPKADQIHYQIQCSRDQLSEFVRDLQAIWSKCSQVNLIVQNQEQKIHIEQVLPYQLHQLVREGDPTGYRRIAGRFSIQNRKQIETQTHPRLFAESSSSPDALSPIPVQPILTAPQQNSIDSSDASEPVEVMLEIQIQTAD